MIDDSNFLACASLDYSLLPTVLLYRYCRSSSHGNLTYVSLSQLEAKDQRIQTNDKLPSEWMNERMNG